MSLINRPYDSYRGNPLREFGVGLQSDNSIFFSRRMTLPSWCCSVESHNSSPLLANFKEKGRVRFGSAISPASVLGESQRRSEDIGTDKRQGPLVGAVPWTLTETAHRTLPDGTVFFKTAQSFIAEHHFKPSIEALSTSSLEQAASFAFIPEQELLSLQQQNTPPQRPEPGRSQEQLVSRLVLQRHKLTETQKRHTWDGHSPPQGELPQPPGPQPPGQHSQPGPLPNPHQRPASEDLRPAIRSPYATPSRGRKPAPSVSFAPRLYYQAVRGRRAGPL